MASVLALRDEAICRAFPASPAPRWEPAFVAALQRIGLDLRPPALDGRADFGDLAWGVPQSSLKMP
jgi:hypothetical protein